MAEEQDKTKLHFTRVRSRGDSTYFDPQTDIRAIYPTAAKMTLDILMEVTKDEAIKKEYEYLAKCFNIYQLRLVEDPTGVAAQVAEFSAAIHKVRPQILTVWQETMLTLLNCLYACFTRRDVKADGKAVRGMLTAAAEAAMLQRLPKAQQEAVYQAFCGAGLEYDEQAALDPNGKVVCEETEQVLENIKELAGIFVSHSGPGDWNSLSAACDAFFQSPEASKLTDEQQTAIALAYPSYDLPYLTVEKSDD